MLSQRRSLLYLAAALFCLVMTGCDATNVTPDWWKHAEVERDSDGEVVGKKPLIRLMALSLPWIWVLIIVVGALGGFKTSDAGPGGIIWITLFYPIGIWVILCVVCVAVLLIYNLGSYALTGTARTVDFAFLFFWLLALTIGLPAVILVFPLLLMVAEYRESVGKALLCGFAIVIEIFGIIFTCRDILHLFRG